jgi:very-short-patch-repair endonuclease
VKLSPLEAKMALHIKAFKLPDAEREYRFHPVRRWRFDFAWPEQKVAVELQGGIWTNGRHSRGAGYVEDCRKSNEAQALGWTLFHLTNEHLDSGEAVTWLTEALKGEKHD